MHLYLNIALLSTNESLVLFNRAELMDIFITKLSLERND